MPDHVVGSGLLRDGALRAGAPPGAPAGTSTSHSADSRAPPRRRTRKSRARRRAARHGQRLVSSGGTRTASAGTPTCGSCAGPVVRSVGATRSVQPVRRGSPRRVSPRGLLDHRRPGPASGCQLRPAGARTAPPPGAVRPRPTPCEGTRAGLRVRCVEHERRPRRPSNSSSAGWSTSRKMPRPWYPGSVAVSTARTARCTAHPYIDELPAEERQQSDDPVTVDRDSAGEAPNGFRSCFQAKNRSNRSSRPSRAMRRAAPGRRAGLRGLPRRISSSATRGNHLNGVSSRRWSGA